MSLKSSTDLLDSEAAEDFVINKLCPIETYAESLMDEIFADIDNILNNNNEQNCHSVGNTYLHKRNTALTRTDASLSPKVHRSLQSAALIKKNVPKTYLVVNSSFPGAITTKDRPQTSGLDNILDKLIYMGFGWSMATLCTLWLTNFALLNRANTQLNSSLQNNQIPSSVYVKSDPQLDLVNYMLSAFSLIEQQERSNYTTTVKPGLTNVSINQTKAIPLPSTQPQIKASSLPIAANNLPPVPQTAIATNATNRKYIPVDQSPASYYQPQIKAPLLPIAANNLPPVPQLALSTNATNRKNIPVDQSPASYYQPRTVSPVRIPQPSYSVVNNPPINNVQPVTKPKIKKTEVNSQPLKDAPPKLATITPTVPEKELVNTPTYSVQLEGILESGDKSVALFNIDGTTRGINLGENIGDTGWILIEVSNGEAIIRRHGEEKSIYAGQKL